MSKIESKNKRANSIAVTYAVDGFCYPSSQLLLTAVVELPLHIYIFLNRQSLSQISNENLKILTENWL